jgi:hypothetical protein
VWFRAKVIFLILAGINVLFFTPASRRASRMGQPIITPAGRRARRPLLADPLGLHHRRRPLHCL